MSGSDYELLSGKRDGVTFDEARDKARLNRQAAAVYDVMRDSRWRTLQDIANLTGEPAPSISARLRDLRKARFGGFQVEREYISDGIWHYRLLPADTTEPVQLELLEAAE